MNEQNAKRLLLHREYIDNSFKRYLDFKHTEQYDEEYKFEILSRLNDFLKGQEITASTVIDIVKKTLKENPVSGSFVHRGNLDDLVSYAEAYPQEVKNRVPVTKTILKTITFFEIVSLC